MDIKWHFIGHLQSNKIKKVLVSNLEYLETIDRQRYLSNKLALHKKYRSIYKKIKLIEN